MSTPINMPTQAPSGASRRQHQLTVGELREHLATLPDCALAQPESPHPTRRNDPAEIPAPLHPTVRIQTAASPLHQHIHKLEQQIAHRAALSADAVLAASFPHTLSPATSEPLAWIGYAPTHDHTASAVAPLGGTGTRGWWLHYTRLQDQLGDPQHILTLIAPCSCGTYLHVKIPDEDTLIAMLDQLDTAPGAPVVCDYRLRIRSASYADQDHDSFAERAAALRDDLSGPEDNDTGGGHRG